LGNRVTRCSAVALVLWATLFLPGVASAATPKIAVIVFENRPYGAIVGEPSAPYFNSLLTQGMAFTDYHAIQKGSAHDYRAMVAGEIKVTSGGPNIFQAIGEADWISLQESMGGNCGKLTSAVVPGTHDPLYVHGHDPAFMYRSSEACRTNDVPFTTDAQLQSLPALTFITPNECDDMHTYPTTGTCPAYFGPVTGTGSIRIADAWLSHVVPILVDAGETVFVVFDETGKNDTQRVYAVEVGAGVASGTVDAATYNHYGLLAGLYAVFGLGTAPHNAATAAPVPFPAAA
jgi:acid phosphatase